MTAIVIDFAARARLRKVIALLATLDRFYARVGEDPDDAALAARLREWHDSDWQTLASFSGVKYPSAETRALVIGEIERRSRLTPVEVQS